MNKKLKRILTLFILFCLPVGGLIQAQLVKDLSRQMEIPNIVNLQSSETHLYALSESDGLVVFRAYSDSLQWLYSSTGMQQRGHILESDIRFAYLYGDSRRLTVIEPTSVLGVYSSTVLPDVPRSAIRIGNELYIALGNSGFGRINLETPESVDSEVEIIHKTTSLDLVSDGGQTVFVLQQEGIIGVYTVREGEVSLSEELQIGKNLDKLFLVKGELMGSDNNGNIFMISSNGQTDPVANVENAVDKISTWQDRTIVRTVTGDIWIGDAAGNFNLWKSGDRAGNYFAVTEGTFWISEYNKIFPIIEQADQQEMANNSISPNSFALSEIEDVVLPYPRPLLLPIEYEGDIRSENVSLSYNASFNNAQIRGNTFYWQPSATQTGRHSVTITASLADGQTDSTQFVINLRPFNSPPRFTPSRPISIPVGEEFELGISAVDPDGMNQSLIRYLGVDMPNGAQINEKTGRFTWNPDIRQVGEHSFRVIATDQYGAASSQDYSIKVVELSAQTGDEEDLFEQ
ncbi:MAG: Ig domain-containing protein [Balneolaceae bacterium]|nr:Ig domain-containing protein [Balneolaceae bacterium]